MRIHAVLGIPGGLEFAERPHQFRAEHFRKQRAARLAVAMLAGKRTAVADHEIGRALDEFAVIANALLALQIEADAHVNAAVPEMSVKRAACSRTRPSACGCRADSLRAFPARQRRRPSLPTPGRAGSKGGGARSGLANVQTMALASAACRGACWADRARCLSRSMSCSARPCASARIVSAELHQQESAALGDQLDIAARRFFRRPSIMLPSKPSRPMGFRSRISMT